MTAPELSADEQARVAAFEAAPVLAESSPIVRAMLALAEELDTWELYYGIAAARIRDDLAAALAADPEPRGEVVERMARAMFETQYPGYLWRHSPAQIVHDLRRLAAAALDAQ